MQRAAHVIGLSIFVAFLIAALVPAERAVALETVTTFAADCTTARTVFHLGDTVCAQVAGVAGGDLTNIFLQWVGPSGTVAFGSAATTLVTTNPQNFPQALPTSGPGAELGRWTARTANVSNAAPRVAAAFRVPRPAVIGVHRDAPGSVFFFRNTNTTGFGEGTIPFGLPGDIGLVGDWDGDGVFTPGVYRPSDGTFYLANSPVAATADLVIPFGPLGGTPLVGDWNGDGTTKIGIHKDDTFSLRNSNTPGPADLTFQYGLVGDTPVVGDWDGDGMTTIGVYRAGVFYLRNSNTSGDADLQFAYGLPGDTPTAGDWTADDGKATIGTYRSSEGVFYLRNSNTTGVADLTIVFGVIGDQPATTPANQAPVVGAGGTLNYTENQAATAIDPALTLTDMDSATLVGATAQITGNCASGEDVLSFTDQNGISGVYTAASCLMTLSGRSSVANYLAALQSVKYNNTSATPSTLARTVTWQVNDGAVANNLSNTPTSTINVTAKASQTITFTSTAPGDAAVGGPTYTVTATGGGSGNPVTFTIDSSATSVCSIAGSTVSFTAVGTCVIDANQAGNATFEPAPQAQQSFAVAKGSQTINFTSSPSSPMVGGPTYTVMATGGASGNSVVFSEGASSVCSVVGSTVSFTAVGTCIIKADQAGDVNYNAAAQVQQSFAVGQGSQTINFTSTAPTDAVVGGPTYTVTATGGASGNAVTFAIDASASTVCSRSGSTVSFGPNGGTCVINANQLGNANYTAAPPAQQSFQVKQAPAITSANSYTKQIGTALSFTVTTTGTPAPTVSQAPVGGQTGFPGGVTFTPSPGSAAIGGSVTSGGAQTYTTTITANNGVPPNATQPFSLIITCPAITVTRTGGGSFPAGTFNVAYTGQSVTGSGGTGPYTFVVATGALPTNLSLASGGGISGTSSATGTFPFTVTATDTTGCTGTSAQFTIAINPVAGSDTYNNLVNNTEAVVTGGTTASPSTPFVSLTGFVTANDTPAGVTITSSNPIATIQGGSVTIAADGSFKYTPPVTVSALASDTFTYTISSNTGGTATPTTANGTVTLNLSGRVWYVNPNAGVNGNGQSQSPWSSTANIKQQPTVGGANTGDAIFVYNGPAGNLTANIPLLASQTLHGEGVALVVNSVTLRSAGTAPSLTASSANVVSVNNANTIKGVTLTNSTNALINGAPAGLTLNTVTMTPSGSANGFDITGGSGTVALTDVTMTGTSSGDVVKVNTGTQSWTFTNSPITQTVGRALDVTNKTGGGMTFDAASTVTVSAGTANGAIVLSNNTGSGNIFTFNGKVALTVSGAARGLVGTSNGGVVNIVDNTSTITASGGAAIDFQNTTIGASGLNFHSVSANGGANGIVLNTTGSGGLTVTGTGTTDGSGGTIQNITAKGANFTSASNISLSNMTFTNAGSTDGGDAGVCDGSTNAGCNAAINLNTVTNVSLTNIDITGGADEGINGQNVTHLTLANSTISNVGNAVNEHGIYIRGLFGTVANGTVNSISNTTVTNAGNHNVFILTSTATNAFPGQPDRLELTGSTFSNPGSAVPSDGVTVAVRGTANFQTVVTGSTFSRVTSACCDGIQVDAGDTSHSDVSITTSTFTGPWGQSAINMSGANTSVTTFNISNNPTITGGVGQGINVASNNDSTLNGTIANNPNITTSQATNAGQGIWVLVDSGGQTTVDINTNTITNFANGIVAGARNTPQGTADITIRNTTVTNGGNFPSYGVWVFSGNGSGGETNRTCLNLSNNNVSIAALGIVEYALEQYSGTTFQLQGLVGSGTSVANVTAHVDARDTGATSVDPIGLSGFINYTAATCATP